MFSEREIRFLFTDEKLFTESTRIFAEPVLLSHDVTKIVI